jgi:hypothetical protein
MRGQNRCNSNEFRVPRAVQCSIGSIHAAADDGSIVDEDAANGGLICCEGELGLRREVSSRDLGVVRRYSRKGGLMYHC